MKFSITAILIVLTAYSQAQDAAVVSQEVTYDAFPIPDVPALKVPATGRAIPYLYSVISLKIILAKWGGTGKIAAMNPLPAA